MNTFGQKLRLTTFGESHGAAIGGVIDGYPAGVTVDFEKLHLAMAERRPGKKNTSARNEEDMPEFLSGISPDGVTLGTPIGFIIRNNDCRSSDYSLLANVFRPNHADFTYHCKYGIRDYRGGGRASARETACRVVAGALAAQFLAAKKIEIRAFLSRVGSVEFEGLSERLSLFPEEAPSILPSDKLLKKYETEIEKARKNLNSVGGAVMCIITGMPVGIGNPVYDKLSARLAGAMMSINAAKAIEFGYGFKFAESMGSQVLDRFEVEDGKVKTLTNFSGGIQGGISNGMPVFFNISFKPTPTISSRIPVLTDKLQTMEMQIPGRHDPCVAVRAVAVVKAMAALSVADFILQG